MVRRPRVLLTRSVVACLTAALALIGGACGSSHSTPAGASVKLASTTTRISDAWPLADHVLTPGAFPGFVRQGPPSVISGPSAWAGVERSAAPRREAARLSSLGFVRAINEHLHARFPIMAEAISTAEQYRIPGQARAELAYQYRQLTRSPGVTVSPFQVGIPGAHGVRVAGGGIVGLNVLFSVGPYYYVVAAGHPANARNAPTAARVVAAAETLYLALTGCSAPSRPAREA